MLAYVNHARIRSWNEPVLSNEGKVPCSRKQRGPLLGLELTTDRHPPTTSQTRYPLCYAAPSYNLNFVQRFTIIVRLFFERCQQHLYKYFPSSKTTYKKTVLSVDLLSNIEYSLVIMCHKIKALPLLILDVITRLEQWWWVFSKLILK